MANRVTVGVVQMVATPGRPGANLEAATRHVERLADRGANLIVLPELFASGYDLEMDLGAAAGEAGRHIDTLTEWADRHQLVLTTALVTRTPEGGLLDLAVIIGAEGVIASSPKRFLWGDERRKFSRRVEPGALAKTSFGTIGVAICYEAGFPEVVRDLALRGADIIAIPAAFGLRRLYAWELLTRSRALENGCFVAAAGLTGSNGVGSDFAGYSRIVSPTGDVLAGLARTEGVVSTELDLDDIHRSRNEIPYLPDLIADRGRATEAQGEVACLTSTL